jgi:hypothetical protein
MSEHAGQQSDPAGAEATRQTEKGILGRLAKLKEKAEPVLWLLPIAIAVGVGVYLALVPYAREVAQEAVLSDESLARIAQLVRPHATVAFNDGNWRIVNDSGADAFIEDLVLSDGTSGYDISLVIKLKGRTTTPPLLRCLTQNVAVHSIFMTNRNDWGYKLVANVQSQYAKGTDGQEHLEMGVWNPLTTKSQFDLLIEIFP